jgi:putative phosphotransacetylase
MSKKLVPVGVSNRHLHITQEDLEKLFGDGAQLTKFKDLSQTGQFACEEMVSLVTCKGQLDKVRILGPVRKETQIEITVTDSFKLGLMVPIRESGNIDQTPGIKLIGPKGSIDLDKGVIIASRHIHMSPNVATEYGVRNGDIVSVKTEGPRSIVYLNVVIRVREDFVLDFHIDTDEANAAFIKTGELLEVIV